MEYLMYFILPLSAFMIAGLIISAAYLTFQQRKGLKTTDSFFGPSVLSDPLIGREKDLRFLISRINTGQSSAIIGPFSQERTAILTYLRNPENARLLYGDQADKLIFSYVDVSSLKIDCTPAEFWERALKPLHEKIAKNADSVISEVYQECKENRFDNYDLEKLVEQMSSEGWRLVLMLDQFEELLPRPLSTPEFGGRLRSLAYVRTPSPLILIISGNMTIPEFHVVIKHKIGFGSPWFNFVEPGVVTLDALSDTDIDELLQKSVSPFTDKADARKFVKDMAGGHPYLVQVAATALLESYKNQETHPEIQARGVFYDRVKGTLAQILQSWSSTTCEAFRAVADKQDVSRFDAELKELQKQGFVKQDENSQWQVRPQVFLKFLKENANQELCKRQQAQPN
ncbi:MAG: hypothetical protein BWK78_01955 [Thiotrichaceae bacterium IS1]|nr:MAG: hypothetical protein BWK78_01955 [Thiotrichaceae bacterium IS1]